MKLKKKKGKINQIKRGKRERVRSLQRLFRYSNDRSDNMYTSIDISSQLTRCVKFFAKSRSNFRLSDAKFQTRLAEQRACENDILALSVYSNIESCQEPRSLAATLEASNLA